jgi:hypothetical protein
MTVLPFILATKACPSPKIAPAVGRTRGNGQQYQQYVAFGLAHQCPQSIEMQRFHPRDLKFEFRRRRDSGHRRSRLEPRSSYKSSCVLCVRIDAVRDLSEEIIGASLFFDCLEDDHLAGITIDSDPDGLLVGIREVLPVSIKALVRPPTFSEREAMCPKRTNRSASLLSMMRTSSRRHLQ